MSKSRPEAGDIVRFVLRRGEIIEYELEEYHYCLGIYETKDHREANDFTPLCELVEPAPDAVKGYISNYGEYYDKYNAVYEIIKKDKI